jgi:hypothetical protein
MKPEVKGLGINLFPAMVGLFKCVPQSKRRNMLIKNSTPKLEHIPDWFDIMGENPYQTTEVITGKVWSVEYSIENFYAFDAEGKAMTQFFGMDFNQEKTVERILKNAELDGGKALVEKTQQDIDHWKKVNAIIEEKGKCLETQKLVKSTKFFMPVIKLNNGEVLLYCPVRVREETGFAEWLDNIGPVKWIVVGSAAHTMMIPSIMKRYPDANYISSRDAWEKLTYIQGWTKMKADFEYENEEDLDKLNNLLENEGVKFHFVKGDVASMAVIPIAHKAAMECDIVYGTSDGGFMDLNGDLKKELGPNGSIDHYETRLFRLATATKPSSPNGYLPIYRFWMMDATSPVSALTPTSPARDGSHCKDMAIALRKVLADDIEHGLGVHTGPITGKVFRESVDANWNWLDGQSLL